jgi:hypothetical protein
MIFFSTAQLDHALREFEAHALHERNHQGIGKQIVEPDPLTTSAVGDVRRRERLGGMLSFYYRRAA